MRLLSDNGNLGLDEGAWALIICCNIWARCKAQFARLDMSLGTKYLLA